VLWCAAMAWLPVLIVGEAVRPRLSLDLRRWATAFPLGMYAACGFVAGKVTGIAGIVDFAQVWTWVAFAATLALLAGLVPSLIPGRAAGDSSAPPPAPSTRRR
jgi:tellurite resistance protein TehA-like permease